MEVDFLDGPKLFVIRGFLSPQECQGFIERSEEVGYVDAPITTSVGFVMRKDIRDNSRVIVNDPGLAAEGPESRSVRSRLSRPGLSRRAPDVRIVRFGEVVMRREAACVS